MKEFTIRSVCYKPMVICRLPRAGLGNQLFPLMKAYVFAHLNHLPVKVINYNQLKPGPWLRREKNKRQYKGFFIFEKPVFFSFIDEIQTKLLLKFNVVREPEINIIKNEMACKNRFLFSEIPHYSRRFDGLKENRELVIKLLWEIIASSNKIELEKLPDPCIGVHVRLGDFRKLKQNEKFGSVGTVRTPEEYFIKMIQNIREMNGTTLPVSIFTDGTRNELPNLCLLPEVSIIEQNNDLVDLILLSRSKIIITSASSTFSYWAAFLSDAVVIMHPEFTGFKIRPEAPIQPLFEGTFDKNNRKLAGQIKSIRCTF